MFSIRRGTIAVCLCLHACGGGGGNNGNSGTGQASYGRIALLESVPADGAVQVALDAKVLLRFDAAMVLDCMQDEDTWLRAAGATTNVPGTFALQEGGRAVAFTPAAPLQAETDYLFQVSPLTCDQTGRILETTAIVTFRTIDTTPPTVVTANVTPGEQGRSRTTPLVVTFSEAPGASSITASSVVLRDSFGQRYTCTRTLAGAALTIQPAADLPGDRTMTLQLAASVADRAGNPLGHTWSVQFRTATDSSPPTVTSIWPADGSTAISPAVQPIVTFDESMDPATVEPSSLLFQDEFGSLVAFAVRSSADQRTLRVQPLQNLQPGRHYVLAFLVSAAAVTDVSGNGLAVTQALSFSTSSDTTPPQLVASAPPSGGAQVSINATPTLSFAEAIDPAWVDETTVRLEANGTPVAAVVDQPAPDQVRLVPVLGLAPATNYTLRVLGGHGGVRDTAGNVLAVDLAITFSTTADGTLPGAILQPADGATAVPANARASIVFDSVLDATTVGSATCELRADDGTPLAATVTLLGGDRVVAIVPAAPLQPGAYYRTFVRGGAEGVRELSGNWLADDLRARFRIGASPDTTPPVVTATINGLDPSRRAGIVVPPSGFTIDISATDGAQVPDMGSVDCVFTGPGSSPTAGSLYAAAMIGFRTFRTMVPAAVALVPGDWMLQVRVADLAGNVGAAVTMPFAVAAPTAAQVPFERTQVVWARTDMDRDGNGRADFDDDLLRLGLASSGDPAGTNAYVRRLLLDAILARANALYGRGSRGEPLDADSVAVRFTTHQPIGIAHLQIALGGLDPEGNRARTYGAQSTGILGRAFFDAHNTETNDRDIATSPGLGVFPAEMFLYQADIHRQLYPGFQTLFAQRFLPLCADMGGTPAGSGPNDAAVLDPAFDPNAANTEQRARWLVVMRAIDDWAVVIGTILAHEVGHSVGLVAPGPAPNGLFGDSSLHDGNSSATEVMAPSVGYEAMVMLDYAFRDVNLAYMRHRILQR